ncbi:MAG: AEC family transporter [Treponemataceae bacterium]
MLFFNAVRGVLSILLMISVGIFLSKKKIIDQKAAKLFSTIVITVALPSFMVSNLTSTYDKEKLVGLAGGLYIPFAVNVICIILAVIIARLIRVPRNRSGTFCTMFSLSNTIFIGLPVNLALFGDASLPYALLYYIATTVFFWTFGSYSIARDGGPSKAKLVSVASLRNILSPPLCGFMAAVFLIMLDIKLPPFLSDTFRYLGNMTTPLSMIFIGIVMASVKLKKMKLDASVVFVLLGRFVIAPALVFTISTVLGLPPLMKNVFVIQSAMPAMTTTSIIAEAYGADAEYAATVTTLTTIVSLLSIPFYMMLLSSG